MAGLTAGTSKSPIWKGKSSEPNLHDEMFQPLIFQGGYSCRLIMTVDRHCGGNTTFEEIPEVEFFTDLETLKRLKPLEPPSGQA